MREEGSWFANWEEELPSPDELMPLSQTLITPDLAAAFDIASSAAGISAAQNQTHLAASAAAAAASAEEFDSVVACDGVSGDGEPARTLKRPRLVWTPQLHKRFVDAVAHLGIKNAVPKTIMQLMNVDGLTRENVASHLQKYRLYLKRMQGLSVAGDPSAGSGNPASSTDHLFAAHHHQFVPFVPIGNYPPSPHHHFIGGPPPPLPQYSSGSGFENRFLARQQFGHHRSGDEFVPESRKILTLFPAGDD